jgi:RNA-dependent RNA polymerase
LAYSQSALHEAAAWFVRPFIDGEGKEVHADHVIASLDNFHDLLHDRVLSFCCARYGARVAQTFSATDRSITVEADELKETPDIKGNGYNFTDGVGTISSELAEAICHSLYHKRHKR